MTEFRAAAQGEAAYRPIVERLAAQAIVDVEAERSQVPEDYDLPEVDRQALAARHGEPGYRQRMIDTYRDGADGWVDDCLAFTRS